jgi:hypothetical protein
MGLDGKATHEPGIMFTVVIALHPISGAGSRKLLKKDSQTWWSSGMTVHSIQKTQNAGPQLNTPSFPMPNVGC